MDRTINKRRGAEMAIIIDRRGLVWMAIIREATNIRGALTRGLRAAMDTFSIWLISSVALFRIVGAPKDSNCSKFSLRTLLKTPSLKSLEKSIATLAEK